LIGPRRPPVGVNCAWTLTNAFAFGCFLFARAIRCRRDRSGARTPRSIRYPLLVRPLARSRYAPSDLRLVYLDGRGLLREATAACARRGFSASNLSIERETNRRVDRPPLTPPGRRVSCRCAG
jgi:hypothetical protein